MWGTAMATDRIPFGGADLRQPERRGGVKDSIEVALGRRVEELRAAHAIGQGAACSGSDECYCREQASGLEEAIGIVRAERIREGKTRGGLSNA